MKAKQIDEVIDALKSLRKKVKKSAQAQAKVEDKLAQIETLVTVIYQHTEPAQNNPKKSKKSAKKESKKSAVAGSVKEESAELASPTGQTIDFHQ